MTLSGSIGKRLGKRNNRVKRVFWLLPLLWLTLQGCYKGSLYVQQEKVEVSSLASSYVHTPDPRKEHFLEGQRLLIGWDLPRSQWKKGVVMKTMIRFWDQKEEIKEEKLQERWGSTSYFFPGATGNQKILSYRVEISSSDGTSLEVWEHPFWVQKIE